MKVIVDGREPFLMLRLVDGLKVPRHTIVLDGESLLDLRILHDCSIIQINNALTNQSDRQRTYDWRGGSALFVNDDFILQDTDKTT